ncbi:hypothetical protein [Mucilaginibacter sp. FT3.2]|uniref:hypothetical protein n=1 Tax=Mucilaginibacter sp. FT3.2 TaxID=2723090 RepID=UPI00161D5E0F|nr:hypothetical protein [Mucilaginibacter sp. FT3.2]MBB6232629.1 hypothetical protein [Mucilaginibacter sp. FT3.2]
MDMHDWPYIKKSARRKKQLVKKDFDKKLIQLDKLHNDLWNKRNNLPMVPLEHPYQRGWQRLFALSTDIQQGNMAQFYQGLLSKINTIRYHQSREFKRRRKRRRRKFVYDDSVQTLRVIDSYNWLQNTLQFTDAEKAFFAPKEVWSYRFSKYIIRYEFTEPWRFILVTIPRIIYEKRLYNDELEQELSEIKNYLDNTRRQTRLYKLKGKTYRYRWDSFQDPRYINHLKNKPMYTSKEAYLDY